jgi:TPR repeat protein
MPHFVRCIDGHVFDAETSPQCPTCGTTVAMPRPPTHSPTASPSADANEDHSIAAAAGTQNEGAATLGIGTRLAHSAVRIVVVGSIVGVVGGVLVYAVLPRLGWSTPSSPPAVSAPSGTGTPTQTAMAPTINRPSQQASSAPQSAVNAAAPAAAPIPQIDISDAIASALKVARVNALYRQGNYAQTVDLARELAAENNPLGAYSLGVMLRSGTIGAQDLTAARKQFVTSARLGDSFGALEAARMLEQGAGGPQDIDGAKALYLFAARSGNADADAALARLNISDQRGLTIFQANDNLVAGKDVDESWKRINEMIAAHSAPAMCLAGWLYGGGHSTPRDFQHALALLHAGSKTNYPTCTWGLSRMVASGLPNLPRSLVQADVLLHLTEGGVSQERLPAVKNEIAELEKQMSDTDKAKAETTLQNGTVQDAAKN